jgi:hypothetical protein
VAVNKAVLADLRPGDVLGFSGYTTQAALINLATYGIPGWNLSHVGIVAEYRDELLLWESLAVTDRPCAVRGDKQSGVQAHRFGYRLADEIQRSGKVWAYCLKRPLNASESAELSGVLYASLGASYDFAGATRSGGMLFGFFERLLRPESLESLFCSELVAASLREVGRFDTLSASSWSPNSLIREGKRRGIWRQIARLA